MALLAACGGPRPAQRADGPRNEAAFQRAAASGAQRQSVIVQRTSLPFLDAVVKNDPVAREWLVRDAARWSDPLARLEMKSGRRFSRAAPMPFCDKFPGGPAALGGSKRQAGHSPDLAAARLT